MRVNIPNLLKTNRPKRKEILKDVFFPIAEAIKNSFQAKAKNIKIFLEYGTLTKDCITRFRVSDNGEGFVQENINSFNELFSDHKKHVGGKGWGRFFMLYFFKRINISSTFENPLYPDKSVYTSWKFDQNFDKLKISSEKLEVIEKFELKATSTVWEFEEPRENFIKDFEYLEKDIEERLFVFLYLKSKIDNFSIEITRSQPYKGKETYEPIVIDEKSIKEIEIKSETIEIQGINKCSHQNFDIYYNIFKKRKDKEKNWSLDYFSICAQGQPVYELNLKDSLPIGSYKYIFFITGNYLDKKVNENRDDIHFKAEEEAQNGEMLGEQDFDLTRESFEDQIKNCVMEIVLKKTGLNYQDIREKAREVFSKTEFYLIPYLDRVKAWDIEKIRRESHKAMNKEREQLVKYHNEIESLIESTTQKTLFKKKEEIQKKLELTSCAREHLLTHYFYARESLINYGKYLLEQIDKSPKDSNFIKIIEEYVHNFIMKKGTIESPLSQLTTLIPNNNLWILGNEFMNFQWAFSDKSIKSISRAIGSDIDNSQEPDIFSVYTNVETFEYSEDLDPRELEDQATALIIEFKRLDLKPSKNTSGTQVVSYVETIESKLKFKRFIAFIILNLEDEKLYNHFITDDYKVLAKVKGKMLRRHYVNRNVDVIVLDFKALILDAEMRDKIFMDILRNHDLR